MAVIVAIGRLPEDTSAMSLGIRAAVGLIIGGAIIVWVRRVLGAMADPPAPPPRTVDASSADVVYRCQTCGTRLRLEIASTGKAPRHCAEEMEVLVEGS